MNRLLLGDCVAVMREHLDNESVTAVVTDPPYALNLLGHDWDKVLPPATAWAESYRVLKPGGMLLAFGGPRTFHRLACSIEDAGFQMRDCLSWLYGSGFPKSQNLGKKVDGWDGYSTALKPAWEPIIMAMKPVEGTFAKNALAHGVAGLNIDACRIGDNAGWSYPNGRGGKGCFGKGSLEKNLTTPMKAEKGRWPANVVQDGTIGLPSDKACFYYCAKPGKAERGDNTHPTVKPLSLMRWLVGLVTMPGGTVILDPFMGSGTTGVACGLEGVDFVGIEMDSDYMDIARKRLET